MGRAPNGPLLRYFYDTEFIDTGREIKFISIGMVCEDGREYYAVNADMDAIEVRDDPWHRVNTWPHLPHSGRRGELLDYANPVVKPRQVIRDELFRFMTAKLGWPQLWAWYDAHDFVVLTQLWGPLHTLPDGLPMNGCCLKQEYDRQGHTTQPTEPADAHHSLNDARWNLEMAYQLGLVDRPDEPIRPTR